MVSCRFSLKPIHWYSKNRFTVLAPLPRHTLSAYCPHGLEDWAAAAEHYTAALELVAQNAQKRNPVAASEEMTHLSLSLYIYYIIYILYYIYYIIYIYISFAYGWTWLLHAKYSWYNEIQWVLVFHGLFHGLWPFRSSPCRLINVALWARESWTKGR